MIIFSSQDPFPLLTLGSYSYKEAQNHSVIADEWLGFQISATEENIRRQNKLPEQQNWEHLSEQAFQTPYIELRNILELLTLKPGDHIVDLGCAYARMAFLILRHFQGVQFTGYELEKERVLEALRVLGPQSSQDIKILPQDLSALSFKAPAADVYFIFDYGTEAAVKKTLEDLKAVASARSVRVVARGRLSRFLIHRDHPWLAEVVTPQHFEHFSIYTS
ncbi:class I SAM-dependent methyltransferase [Bdellovibrio sp. 22V]|uniref:SAM-dependent methyltransferase n=1 Tax=Bdellovibrio TaxID=958 RepID=UPI0025435015|nr:class I SAM-dependent methyltransferase [Bdellovibrio sp. 22V]WII72233.1 class I SAM-dependent methyltransferase [Bdellovibrio sp. 22V]